MHGITGRDLVWAGVIAWCGAAALNSAIEVPPITFAGGFGLAGSLAGAALGIWQLYDPAAPPPIQRKDAPQRDAVIVRWINRLSISAALALLGTAALLTMHYWPR